MASREEWCADQLSKLLQEDLRITALNEIKDHLTSLPQEEVSRTANVLDLPLVFDCLNDTNNEQVDLACEVLSLCMNNLDLGESTSRYGVPLERALKHPYPSVKIMALKEISRNISSEDVLVDLCRRTSLLSTIIYCIGDDELIVGENASDVIVAVGSSVPGINTLVSNDIINVFHAVMEKNEVIRLRVYQVFVDISKSSEHSFAKLKSVGFLEQMMDELNNNDVLLQLNIIELLSQLGRQQHGYVYLEENGILDKIFSLIEDPNDLITIQLCEPGVLKFFGHVAHKKPMELLSKYPNMFERIFANIESGDLTIIGITLDTIGHIGVTSSGKIALHATGNKMTYAIKTIAKLLSSLPTDIRIRALNCIESLLQVTDTTRKEDISKITRNWYLLLGDDPMSVVLRYAKNPFSELKIAGLGILNALAGQTWGQEEIKNSPGLMEYLLDRNVETVKECKEAKYDIVRHLSTSDVFDQSVLTKLQTFIKEGPFYVNVVTEVAIEGND